MILIWAGSGGSAETVPSHEGPPAMPDLRGSDEAFTNAC